MGTSTFVQMITDSARAMHVKAFSKDGQLSLKHFSLFVCRLSRGRIG